MVSTENTDSKGLPAKHVDDTSEPKPLLSLPDKDVDLGCGGCTHWLTLDEDTAGSPE